MSFTSRLDRKPSIAVDKAVCTDEERVDVSASRPVLGDGVEALVLAPESLDRFAAACRLSIFFELHNQLNHAQKLNSTSSKLAS